jgi:hypothetical protein
MSSSKAALSKVADVHLAIAEGFPVLTAELKESESLDSPSEVDSCMMDLCSRKVTFRARFLSITLSAAAITASFVKPNSSCTHLRGAEAPKLSIPTCSPSKPTKEPQD